MELAVLQLFQLSHSAAGIDIRSGTDGKGDQHLICMETGILALHMIYLQSLDGNDNIGRDQFDLVIDLCKGLKSIEESGRGRAHEDCCPSRHHPSVGKLQSNRRFPSAVGNCKGRRNGLAVFRFDAESSHEALDAMTLPFFAGVLFFLTGKKMQKTMSSMDSSSRTATFQNG